MAKDKSKTTLTEASFLWLWVEIKSATPFSDLKARADDNPKANKTIEGAIGGLFFSTIGSVLYIRCDFYKII